ncbi:MAG: hypothetical protein NTW79_04555 [Candidatus Berkelbacteria bacterium]|nr:hypothetical protein [Candidatus Berkelbacteria bacterium]
MNFVRYFSKLNTFYSPTVFAHYKLVAILFVVMIFSSYVIDFFLSQSIFGERYRIFLAPGVIIHELAHGFGCLITGAKVTEMSFFDKDGGHVKHRKSKIPILGSVIISLAPLVAGIVIIYFISRHLNIASADISTTKNLSSSLIVASSNLLKSVIHLSVRNLLLLYLTISVAVTMIPSRQDILNSIISLVIIAVGFLLVSKYLGILLPVDRLGILLFSVINLLLIGAIFAIILFALTNLFRR